MKINVLTEVGNVKYGDIFYFSNKCYIRIEDIRISDTKAFNAIDLETGKAIELNYCDKVVKLNAIN